MGNPCSPTLSQAPSTVLFCLARKKVDRFSVRPAGALTVGRPLQLSEPVSELPLRNSQREKTDHVHYTTQISGPWLSRVGLEFLSSSELDRILSLILPFFRHFLHFWIDYTFTWFLNWQVLKCTVKNLSSLPVTALPSFYASSRKTTITSVSSPSNFMLMKANVSIHYFTTLFPTNVIQAVVKFLQINISNVFFIFK